MYLANLHVEDDHDESKETSKHLKKHQRMMIAQSVKIAPLQVAVVSIISYYQLIFLFYRLVVSSS